MKTCSFQQRSALTKLFFMFFLTFFLPSVTLAKEKIIIWGPKRVTRVHGGNFFYEQINFQQAAADRQTVIIRNENGDVLARFELPPGYGLSFAPPDKLLIDEAEPYADCDEAIPCTTTMYLSDLFGNRLRSFEPSQRGPTGGLSRDGKALIGWSHLDSEDKTCPTEAFGPRPARPPKPGGLSFYLLVYSLPLSGGQGKIFSQDEFASCWEGQSWAEDFIVEPLLVLSGDDFILKAEDAFGSLIFRWAKGQCVWKLPYQPTPWDADFGHGIDDLEGNRLLLCGAKGCVLLDAEKGQIAKLVDLREHVAQLIELLTPARPGLAQALAAAAKQQDRHQVPGERRSTWGELFHLEHVHFLPDECYLFVGKPFNQADPEAAGWGSWALVFDGKKKAFTGPELLWAAAKAGKISDKLRQNPYATGRWDAERGVPIPFEYYPFATATGKVFVYDEKGELVQLQ